MPELNDYKLVTITAPAVEPVTGSDLIDYMGFSSPDEVRGTDLLIRAGRRYVENFTRRVLITTTFEVSYDGFADYGMLAPDPVPSVMNARYQSCGLRLPRGPVTSIVSIKYDDQAGVEHTLSPSAYVLDEKFGVATVRPTFGVVWPVTSFNPNSVRIRFVAGIADDADDNNLDDYKLSILGWCSQNYDNRELVTEGKAAAEVPHGLASLLRSLSFPEA